MTNWQDKYKDLEVGQIAWYWHKEKGESWKIIEVRCVVLMQDGCKIIRNESRPFYGCLISEDFPNGPKCLTPDEMGVVEKEKSNDFC